ncbi:MAG: peptidylprolyl isomerase [Planctomycetes bacterium]|nr:peptidylprolyl isomerase [Planctomycetota bacterium]MCB9885413.1 peptidylprolyl isomerase [Planctomycetota bacterium]
MSTPIRLAAALAVLFAAAAPIAAQGKRPKDDKPPKAQKDEKGEKVASLKPAKDDPVTAKDKAIVTIDKFAKKKVSTKRADWKTALPAPPELEFTAERDYFWHVQTTKGVLVVRLFPDTAPKHVASAIYLARTGFYDGLQFPRILKGFMAQGGSPLNSTAGNAGYTLDGEFDKPRKHEAAGTLSAANSGAPNTDGSQFFLTFVPTPHLDGKHTVYGQVVEGLEVLKAIEACGVEKDGDALPETPAIVATWIRVAAPADGK